MMASFGGQLLTAICGISLTLILFALSLLVQSLPTILRLLQELVSAVIQLSAALYREIFKAIYPSILSRKEWWILASIILSLLLIAGIPYLVTHHLKTWLLVLAFIHGLAVGLDGNDDNDHYLHLGTDL